MEKPFKLLVRSWLPGRGCVHQCFGAMSEADARELLEMGRGAIDKVQEFGGIEEIPLANGRAYVKARRSPDPDEPRRTAPGFVLVSITDPHAFLRSSLTGSSRNCSGPAPKRSWIRSLRQAKATSANGAGRPSTSADRRQPRRTRLGRGCGVVRNSA